MLQSKCRLFVNQTLIVESEQSQVAGQIIDEFVDFGGGSSNRGNFD
jgi:hypothetical protein